MRNTREIITNRSSNVIESLEELNRLNNELPFGESEEDKQACEMFSDHIDNLHLRYRAIRAYYAAER